MHASVFSTIVVQTLGSLLLALISGVYTGWLVARYYAFNEQLQAARRKTMRLADYLQRMLLNAPSRMAAHNLVLQFFIDQSANLKFMGFEPAADHLTKVSLGTQDCLMTLYDRVKVCEGRGDAQGAVVQIESVHSLIDAILVDIGDTPLPKVDLFFGGRAGKCYRRVCRRSRKWQNYINGKADDWN